MNIICVTGMIRLQGKNIGSGSECDRPKITRSGSSSLRYTYIGKSAQMSFSLKQFSTGFRITRKEYVEEGDVKM